MSLLTGLKRFLVPENTLKGDLDVAFAGLTTLETIAMPGNRLSGTVPTDIFKNNTGLMLMTVAGNSLTGPIPSEISAATKMYELKLSQNQLTGTIPPAIGGLVQLSKHFIIVSIDAYHFRFAFSLCPCGFLVRITETLELHSNKLVGAIPDELYSLSKLETMSIKENPGMNGTISPLIAQLSDLTSLYFGFTGIGGTIPDAMFSLTDLAEINFESAAFSGTIPEAFRRLNASLMDLFLNDNNFTGQVPEAFNHLTALGEFVSGRIIMLGACFLILKALFCSFFRNIADPRKSVDRQHLGCCLR
jgi:hypothetical protein